MAKPVWSRVPGYALCLRSLTGTDIRVLGAICLHVDREGCRCFALVRTLAREAGVDRAQFFKSTKRLIGAGVVTRESHQLDGEASVYCVAMEAPGVFKTTTPTVVEGVEEFTTPPVSEMVTPGVGSRATEESSVSPLGSGEKHDAPTINRPNNRSPNRLTAGGWGERQDRQARLRATALNSFAELRNRRTRVETPTGPRYQLDRQVLATLDERDRFALSCAGGAAAVASSDDSSVNLNVARKHYVDAWIGYESAGVPAKSVASG